MTMVAAGADRGEAPSKDHREGFRLIVKMDDELGGDVREFLSTSVAAWNGIDALHDAYCEQAPKHPGELPVAKISNVVKKKTSSGFSCTPVFEIVDWVERPDDMSKPRASDQRRPTKAAPFAEDAIPF